MSRANGPVTVCVINLKGGVGKSTISALIARRGYTYRKLDVLAIDLDPQANLSQGLMRGDYNNFLTQKRPSIVEIFNGYMPPTAVSPTPSSLTPSSGVETIAQTGERSFQLIPSRFDFSDNLLGAVRPDPRTLARFLSENFQHKDLIIIDCAPTESILTTAAYHASGNVLVPVKPEFFATIGFPLLQQSLSNFRNQNRGHHNFGLWNSHQQRLLRRRKRWWSRESARHRRSQGRSQKEQLAHIQQPNSPFSRVSKAHAR